MSVKDINKTIEQLVKEYKDSILTYEKIIKIFPKAPTGTTVKKLLALIQLYNVTVISSQEQAKFMNDEEAKKRREQREKLISNEDDEFDLLKNKELLEWSRSDSPVRMYLREMGQIPLLTKEEEIEIVNWIMECYERGFPVTKMRLLDHVQKFVVESNRVTPFRNGRPGHNWYKMFMRRHPVLSNRVAQNLTCIRASVTEKEVREWFDRVKVYLEEKGLINIENKRVFNLDESAFKLVPDSGKVIAPKGARTVYQVVGSSDKATVTILFTASASGVLAPPLILFECKTTPKRSTLQYIPKGWGVGSTENGWMTGESFFSFIKNIFYPWLVENDYQFPIILYVDNHSSHVNLQLLQFCKEKMIEIIALYPNSTHLIQPLDVAFFHPLKEVYKKAIVEYKLEKGIVDIKKAMVPVILKKALEKMNYAEGIKNGFRSSGLYPFNADAVDFNILKKKSKKKKDSVNKNSAANNVVNQSSNKNIVELLNFFETNIISPTTLEVFLKEEYKES